MLVLELRTVSGEKGRSSNLKPKQPFKTLVHVRILTEAVVTQLGSLCDNSLTCSLTTSTVFYRHSSIKNVCFKDIFFSL